MLRLRRTLAALVLPALILTGCEDGAVTAPDGEVRGVVMVEGSSVANVTVELTGPQARTVTTDESGRYSFDDVPPGAFVVSVRNVPEDASFPATSRTAVVSGSQTVTVDFVGNFIRTASISGSVSAGSQGLAGVAVELSGVETAEGLTGAGGAFQFTGLRAGSYEVEISGLPESVTFPLTRAGVDLSTGESRLVTFEGSAELTASVVIRSIARRTASGGTEPADPQNLRGILDVTLTVDQGEDTLSGVDLLLGETLVGQQLFDGSLAAPEAEATAPDGAAPVDIVFTVNTAEFDAETGEVRFQNGSRLLTARLATEEGGASAWLASVPVQLRNQNTFTGALGSGRGPVSGDDGEEWVGGGLTVTVVPVRYDPSRTVESVTVGLRREQGSRVRVATVAGSAPFSAVFADAGPPGPGNVVGYQTPRESVDEIRVVAATYADGGSVPGVPAVLVPAVRIDNLGPEPATFRLPPQSSDSDCCLRNWVGADFEFHEAVTLAEDAGVGGVTASIHAGEATLPDEALAALPEVLVGGDLAATSGNSAYRAVATSRDALGNVTVSPLSPATNNALSNPRGAVFGVDLALPQLDFSSASVGDRAVNPAPGAAWVLAIDDATSGAGPLPSRATVRLEAPGVEDGTAAACLFPGTEDCAPGVDGVARGVPMGVEGYLSFESYVLDRAGNRSNPRGRTALRDVTLPAIPSIGEPTGALIPGGAVTVSALLTDNVDLHRGWVSLEFEAGNGSPVVAFAGAQVLGQPFDGDLTPTASLMRTIPVVIGLEDVEAGAETAAPTGTLRDLAAVRAVAVDAAGNQMGRSADLAVAGSFDLTSFSVAARGESGGVGDWELTAGADRVCRAGAGVCPDGVSEAVILTARARGSAGQLEEPFEAVHFAVVRDGEPEWIGSSDTSVPADGAGPLGRSWSWSLGWSPGADVPAGSVGLVAVGVDGDGNALRTLVLASLSVES